MSKVLTIVGVSILALSLVLGIALPALAAPSVPKPWAEDFPGKIVPGKVTSVDAVNQQFVIQPGEEEITVKVDENTKYFKIDVPGRIRSLVRHWEEFRHRNQEGTDVPASESPKLNWLRPFGEEATFSDIAVGDRVVVWLAKDSEPPLAERVLITKVTTYASVSGTITDVSSTSITITPGDGEAVTLSYNESTIFTLKGVIQVVPGQSAHAVYNSENMLAQRVTVNQEVVEPTE